MDASDPPNGFHENTLGTVLGRKPHSLRVLINGKRVAAST